MAVVVFPETKHEREREIPTEKTTTWTPEAPPATLERTIIVCVVYAIVYHLRRPVPDE